MLFRPSKQACRSLLTAGKYRLEELLKEEFPEWAGFPPEFGDNPVLHLFEQDGGDACRKEVGLGIIAVFLGMAEDVRQAHEEVGTPLLLRLATPQEFVPFVVDEVRREMEMPEESKAPLAVICEEFRSWCKSNPECAWEFGFDFDDEGGLYLDCQVCFEVATLDAYDDQAQTN